jgi:hypothetical protein
MQRQIAKIIEPEDFIGITKVVRKDMVDES